MFFTDLVWFLFSLLGGALAIVIAERFARRGYVLFARKGLHMVAGLWVWLAAVQFETWIYAALIPLVFFIINFALRRGGELTIDRKVDHLGFIYFPLAILLLIFFTWNPAFMPSFSNAVTYHLYRIIAILGAVTLGFGDAFATLIGRGARHHFHLAGKEISIRGSIAMFLASLISIFLVLRLFGGFSLESPTMYVATVTLALVATIFEAISKRGIDNLTIPIAVAIVARFWIFKV
ncbi:MAG: hypothetical protein HY459_00945 [Parcubacteria group bacterium]|nr:hypothetical protein [Parcubacteria group bacterium]